MSIDGKWLIVKSNRPLNDMGLSLALGAICEYGNDGIVITYLPDGRKYSLRYNFNKNERKLIIIYASGGESIHDVSFMGESGEFIKIQDINNFYDVYRRIW